MNFSTTVLHDVKEITSRIRKLDNNNGYVLTLEVTQERTDYRGNKQRAELNLKFFSNTKAELEIV